MSWKRFDQNAKAERRLKKSAKSPFAEQAEKLLWRPNG
jgi:hypothetical protein